MVPGDVYLCKAVCPLPLVSAFVINQGCGVGRSFPQLFGDYFCFSSLWLSKGKGRERFVQPKRDGRESSQQNSGDGRSFPDFTVTVFVFRRCVWVKGREGRERKRFVMLKEGPTREQTKKKDSET